MVSYRTAAVLLIWLASPWDGRYGIIVNAFYICDMTFFYAARWSDPRWIHLYFYFASYLHGMFPVRMLYQICRCHICYWLEHYNLEWRKTWWIGGRMKYSKISVVGNGNGDSVGGVDGGGGGGGMLCVMWMRKGTRNITDNSLVGGGGGGYIIWWMH